VISSRSTIPDPSWRVAPFAPRCGGAYAVGKPVRTRPRELRIDTIAVRGLDFAMKTRLPLALFALIAACGAPKPVPPPPAPPPPPVDENLLALAPAAYSQVARIDLEALRNSPLWSLSELAMTDATFAALRAAGGENDPLLAIDEILITGGDPSGSGADELLVVAKGRIDADALAAAISARPAAKGSDGAAGPAIEVAALTGRTIALGTTAIMKEASALAKREGRALLDDEAFSDLALAKGTAAVYRFRGGTEALAIDRLRAAPFKNLGWSRHAVSASGSLKIAAGATAEITFALDDPKIAERARRDLKRTVKRFAGNAIIRLMGVGNLLGRVAITGENGNVEVRASLSEADVAQVQTLVDRFAQIRELMAGDEDDEGDEPVELDPPMLKHETKAPLGAEKAE
jgi:hypothetical protein